MSQRTPHCTSDKKREKLFRDHDYYEKPSSYSASEEVRRNLSYTRRVNTSTSRDSSSGEDGRKRSKESSSSLLCCLLCLPFRCVYQSIMTTAKMTCYAFIAGIAAVLIFQVLVYFSLFSTASNKYFGDVNGGAENTPNTLFDRTAQTIGTVLGATYFSAETTYSIAKWTVNTSTYWLGVTLDFIEYWRGNRPSIFTKYEDNEYQDQSFDRRY